MSKKKQKNADDVIQVVTILKLLYVQIYDYTVKSVIERTLAVYRSLQKYKGMSMYMNNMAHMSGSLGGFTIRLIVD